MFHPLIRHHGVFDLPEVFCHSAILAFQAELDKDNFAERNGSNVTEVRPHLTKAAIRKGSSCGWGLRETLLVRAAHDRLEKS